MKEQFRCDSGTKHPGANYPGGHQPAPIAAFNPTASNGLLPRSTGSIRRHGFVPHRTLVPPPNHLTCKHFSAITRSLLMEYASFRLDPSMDDSD